ncbi:hypothetical protein G6F32_014839 [Rhizopus arrhizus]|nr:hypothetical protein G6F32_014839 [Rhizopus arrhizus]
MAWIYGVVFNSIARITIGLAQSGVCSSSATDTGYCSWPCAIASTGSGSTQPSASAGAMWVTGATAAISAFWNSACGSSLLPIT